MNNGTTETTQASATRAVASTNASDDALNQAKRELMQAEVRLAKARATVVSAEIDIKSITARLRALSK